MHRLAIWTVGHSNHTFQTLGELLRLAKIELVVDVRSYPYSRYAPQFSREELQSSLSELEIAYMFMGEQLGGRPVRDEHYDERGHALYELMAQEQGFQDAIEQLLVRSVGERIAILCAEADPEHCHRRLLVGKVLAERDVELRHIFADGSIFSEQQVALPRYTQDTLFGEGERPWRSTQSVLHRRALSTFSID
jgi:uncharacterized protein (DUF488 family)